MNEKKKKIVTITVVGIILILIILVTATYAYFNAMNKTEKREIITAKVALLLELDEKVTHITNIKPTKWSENINDNNQNKDIAYIPFKVTNNSNIDINYNLTLNSLNLKLGSSSDLVNSGKLSDVKFKLYDGSNTEIIQGTLDSPTLKQKVISNKKINTSESQNYILYIYIEESNNKQNNLQDITFDVNLEVNEATSENIPNKPNLTSGMIPVVYDESIESWVKIDEDSDMWYDYENGKWANVVTVTNETRNNYTSAPSETPISMNDINSMWVWIPRYKYRIPNSIGTGTSVNPITNPPEINIIFEKDTNTTGVSETEYKTGIKEDGTNANYYTHPAFTFGDKELTGIWVGKFETSTNDENCNKNSNTDNCSNVSPIIKPDILSLRNQNVSTQFITALKFANGTFNSDTGDVTFSSNSENPYGFNTSNSNINTHMAKSTEWGAVAILSQSKYGKKGNSYYNLEKKEIYKNNSYGRYTGRSEGDTLSSENSYGNYSYNDYTCNTSNEICNGNKVSGLGRGSSTTGTIYGIYDMNGGSWEYVMSHCKDNLGDAGFTVLPTGEYVDEYQNCISGTSIDALLPTKDKTILGEATWEALLWYNDYYYSPTAYPTTQCAWAMRGGRSSYTDNTSGIFATSSTQYGHAVSNYSFRTILFQ